VTCHFVFLRVDVERIELGIGEAFWGVSNRVLRFAVTCICLSHRSESKDVVFNED